MRFTSTLTFLALVVVSNCTGLGKRSLSGEATYYGGNVAGGTCSFSTYTLPSGIYGTALSDSNWDNSGECGACVTVTGPSGNSITAMIVDECPGCGLNHLDLFPDAFSALANPTLGIIDVSWDYIDCPISTPLQLHNKDGVSAYWFSMQVVNANQAVASLEVSTDGGNTWTATTRQTYNFFENSSGFGTTTVDVRVTSVNGDVVIVNDVPVSSGESVTAASNFGTSSSAPAPAAAIVATPSSTSPDPTIAATSTTPVVIVPESTPTTEPAAAVSTTTSIAAANFQQLATKSTTSSPSTSPTSTTIVQASSASPSTVSTTSVSSGAEITSISGGIVTTSNSSKAWYTTSSTSGGIVTTTNSSKVFYTTSSSKSVSVASTNTSSTSVVKASATGAAQRMGASGIGILVGVVGVGFAML